MVMIASPATPSQLDAARELLSEYATWTLEVVFGGVRSPGLADVDVELATLPGRYAPPDGRLLLAMFDGRLAGCVALRRHDATSGEVKRLYVRPAFRGQRLGEQLVAAVIAAARDIGYRRLVLDSHRAMTRAHALYRAAGFRDVDAPPDYPERFRPIAIFMEREFA